MTGATGFLGLHLLRELLSRHSRITVLARAEESAVRGRIDRFLRLTGTESRVRVVRADITRPRLGLPEPEFTDLAGGLDVLWHCAADISPGADLEQLRRVNVTGVRHVLELAAAAPRRPAVRHVSTIAVAGARRHGLIGEDWLDAGRGFENSYERTKYEAEVLLRQWAAETQLPVTVFRPAGLVSDLPLGPDLPRHPLSALAELIEGPLSNCAPVAPPVVRVPGDGTAVLNLLQAEHAANTMVRLAGHQSAGVDTYHVVHPRDTLVSDLLTAFNRVLPVRFQLVPRAPAHPSPLETVVRDHASLLAYTRHHRRFDDARVRALLGPATAPPIGLGYLEASIRGWQLATP
ncbi:SDR family oxidoreductase [Amycolatopsis sp. H20-H5]|uniref:SDR family oxidoreductase n=1 Tax=Amycolatopsis sp. H20-H5 TaxID=3046309 RepID=UPI002DB9C75C|nr:SDR family oxidoreductase [Amycolatopsis sp. H20-H5]MEC3974509.1 SDR family oxidoreductase [Amycolatopsis sp. H20-H5]